ncbi:hypothetical protein KKF84_14495, partial [Myxococcota bacterium]|nr:hypothetical protein [Myxococcota bacterium]
KTVKVPTMFHRSRHSYVRGTNYKALRLTYKNSSISMLIILPDQDVDALGLAKDLPTILNISKGSVGLLSTMQLRLIDLYLPRFTFKKKNDLKKSLVSLGLTHPFSETSAQFANMNPSLYIKSLTQEAKIEVNEKGTKARAVTRVRMASMSAGSITQSVKLFRVDHPFLFVIVDEATGTILFLGLMENPALRK